MKRYFFYTDPAKISQAPGQEFGPAQVGTPGGATGAKEDKYRITNLHSGTDAPAIAVCSGIICVQEDDQGTYSIILKPDYQPPFDFPYIKYFIYKGIKKDALVKAGTTEIADGNTIPFLERIREDDDHWDLPANDITTSEGILGLVYKSPFSYTIDSKSVNIFDDEQPIDNFFYYPNPDFQLPTVKAGEKMGLFEDATFGFEIVLERLGYEPKIKLARTKVNYIEVDAIENPLNEVGHSSGKTWAVDDANYFLHWHEKEACLNYIDPCAFYGSFCGTKVFYINTNGDRKKCNTPEEIYDGLLIGFENRNKIYLDIRNDYGYSLNYYKNYGNNFKVSYNFSDDLNNHELNYYKDRWPIFTQELPSTQDKDLCIGIPSFENNEPLVLFKTKLPNPKANKKIILTLNNDNWLEIKIKNVKFILNQKQISAYFSLKYFKTNAHKHDYLNSGLFPSKNTEYDKIFRPAEMIQLDLNPYKIKYKIWDYEVILESSVEDNSYSIGKLAMVSSHKHDALIASPVFWKKKEHIEHLCNTKSNESMSLLNFYKSKLSLNPQNEYYHSTVLNNEFHNIKVIEPLHNDNFLQRKLDDLIIILKKLNLESLIQNTAKGLLSITEIDNNENSVLNELNISRLKDRNGKITTDQSINKLNIKGKF